MCALMYPYDDDEFGQLPNPGDALKKFVDDPLYWREQDPEFRHYVDQSFKTVYGDEAAEQDATGRTMIPEERAVSLPPFRPRIEPGDLELKGGVGENQPNRWRDVYTVQKGLAATGLYPLDLSREKSGEYSSALAQSIRDFQREKKEEVDGLLLPSGPTIQRLGESLFGSDARPAALGVGNMRAALSGPNAWSDILRPLRMFPVEPPLPMAPPADRDDDAGAARIVPAQAERPPISPADTTPRRTHRQAEDRSIERMVPYQVVDLPDYGIAKRRFASALNGHRERESSIVADGPGRFVVRESPEYKGREPWYASHDAGVAAVETFDKLIREEAGRIRVDPDLVRAIMYVENAQGHYFGAAKAAEGFKWAKSVFPMNIRPDIWSRLGFSDRDFYNPRTNIRAAALLIKRIHERVEEPTVSKIATLYNLLPRNSVTEFGARVAEVYHSKAWDRFKDK